MEDSTTKPQEVGFRLEHHPDGAYLTVDAACRAELQGVLQTVASEASEYDPEEIQKCLSEKTGKAVRIGMSLPLPEIKWMVSKDRMEVVLEIESGEKFRKANPQDVIAKLNAAGIVSGIDESAVAKVCKHPGASVVCATGRKAVDGKNAIINILVNTDDSGRPAELEDGRVDFKNLNLFTVVESGQALAEKVPATPGEEGQDVLGNPVFPRPGKDIPLPIGKNVEIRDELIVVSSVSGQFNYANRKISVLPIIEIKGDVDLSTGNVNFVGGVIVRGSVTEGFSVKAGENVEVHGSVCGGVVEGQNVFIKMGVQGMHKGRILAEKNVVAKFIENAQVVAGEEVIVSEAILHSKVSAGKRIIVDGKRGMVIGGTITAGEEIRSKSLGTHMATNTEVEVGVNPMLREEHQALKRDLRKQELSLDQTQKALALLRSRDLNSLPPEKRDIMLKMTKAQFQLAGQVESMRARMVEIELSLEEMRNGRVRVMDTVYPGVKIVLGNLVKFIREPEKFVSYYAEDGDIHKGSYK